MQKTVGQTIREARVKAGMTQKELAAKIMRKEEGRGEEKAITPQYLNDIEHDRRTPPEYILKQTARILKTRRALMAFSFVFRNGHADAICCCGRRRIQVI